jgi:PAT family beta-lactamase induction signal transducer AmpG
MTRPQATFMSTPAKLGLLGALYFSQGLPFGFFTQALPVMLRESGFSLGAIGLTQMLAMPWGLKFLWAPAVDRYSFPGVGPRKSWIVPLQLGAVFMLGLLALADTESRMGLLLAAVFVVNLLSATQDIATDGLAIDMLAPSERGFANGVQVAGYRVGMIVGGGVLLILFGSLGNSSTFAAMAALIALASIPVMVTEEPRVRASVASSEGAARPPHFFRRKGALGILLLVTVYKVGDAFATGMLRPFLVDAGLGMTDIGWLLGTVGFVAGMLGALAGGVLVNRLGRKPSLLLFSGLQAVTVLGYAALSLMDSMPSLFLYTVCGLEHFAGGMATAALFTCMMDWSRPEYAATDYTVQASAVVFGSGLASLLSGFSAEAIGYFAHFVSAALLALVSLLLVAFLFPSQPASAAGEESEVDLPASA